MDKKYLLNAYKEKNANVTLMGMDPDKLPNSADCGNQWSSTYYDR